MQSLQKNISRKNFLATWIVLIKHIKQTEQTLINMRIELSRYCSTHYGDIFTANHWADTDKIKHSYNQKQHNKPKQPCSKLLTYAQTEETNLKPGLGAF